MAKPKHGRLDNASRVPSPAVLSALALIATVPPVVAGVPLPPTSPPAFLCPFIERDIIPVPPSPSVAQQGSYPKCDVVADKYVQGPDSLWRKTGRWTLYGSTCMTTANMQPQSSSTPTSTSSPNTLDTTFDSSALPAGWDGATAPKSTTESTTILALAIVLAGSICAFMIVCVIWRRRRKKARDVERKLAQERRDDPLDARGKMRMWAKATARWKSNVRHSARRRRKRQYVSSAANRPLSPTPSDSPQLSLVAPSAPSHRGSITSKEPDPPPRPEAALPRDGNTIDPSTVFHDSLRPASPPTYGAPFVPPPSPIPIWSATPSAAGPDSVQRSDQPSLADDEPLPYVPPSDGHVATDDKSLLAHIWQLASSPPINVASASVMQSVSAPEWCEVEDDLEDLHVCLSEVPTPLAFPPAFPPPPSKADIPSPFDYLDDQPLYYGDGDDVLLPISAPGSLLGALPSAPPIEDIGIEPSAPSLEDGDELFQDWDGASSHVPEVGTSGDLDSTPLRATESLIRSTIPSPLRDTSFPSATGDGTLPRYYP